MPNTEACILNTGSNAWAFEPLAKQLAESTELPVRDSPTRFNYLLACDELPADAADQRYFVPLESIRIASDKRLIASTFEAAQVPRPQTYLVDTLDAARQVAKNRSEQRWCLKYPTGCGATGHRLLENITRLPVDWPTPLILQEFIVMERPEVFRTYAVDGELFGWIARRFPEGRKTSPWVAHARGAEYASCGNMPPQAESVARAALIAANLMDSFGCVDLLQATNSQWLALEVGTDGWNSHVDRETNIPDLDELLQTKLAQAILGYVRLVAGVERSAPPERSGR